MPDLELAVSGEAGEILGVSAARIRQMANEGKFQTVFRTQKGVRLFLRSEVEQLKTARQQQRQREATTA